MSAAAIIQKAREDGLSLAVTERDTIKVIGPRVAANRWAPELVANKPAILAELRQAGALPWPAPRIKREEPFGLDHVPERYLAAWRSLLSQCPASVGPFVGEAAKHDAAILFGDFGRLLGEYQWPPGDLFDVPHNGKSGGLVWFIKGSPVTAIGHGMAQTQDARIWLRARLKAAMETVRREENR